MSLNISVHPHNSITSVESLRGCKRGRHQLSQLPSATKLSRPISRSSVPVVVAGSTNTCCTAGAMLSRRDAAAHHGPSS